jgi:hypothetical protein
MNAINLGLPCQEYDHIQNCGKLTESVRSEMAQFLKAKKIERIVVFGSDRTGKAVKETLGKRFAGFVDSDSLNQLMDTDFDGILLATSPLHYQVITEKIAETLNDRPVMVVTLFNGTEDIDIRLILETQPRSGTHYTINNLMQCLKWGYGSVFHDFADARYVQAADGLFCFIPRPDANGYVIKTHFTKTLHYPEYRYVRTMFQISYVMDSYYSWGKTISQVPSGSVYKLRGDSKEWEVLRSYIPLNKLWSQYLSDKFYVRYEDYYLEFDATIQHIADFIGIPSLSGFEKPRKNNLRMYWSNDYHIFFEEEVFSTLVREFYPFISQYWPEKLPSLRYK